MTVTFYAWVIEKGDTKRPQYAACSNGVLFWSHLNKDALRFSRRVDAERIAELFKDFDRVTEHGWDD